MAPCNLLPVEGEGTLASLPSSSSPSSPFMGVLPLNARHGSRSPPEPAAQMSLVRALRYNTSFDFLLPNNHDPDSWEQTPSYAYHPWTTAATSAGVGSSGSSGEYRGRAQMQRLLLTTVRSVLSFIDDSDAEDDDTVEEVAAEDSTMEEHRHLDQ